MMPSQPAPSLNSSEPSSPPGWSEAESRTAPDAVAEQDARAPIRPVEEATQHLHPDHQHLAVHAAADEGIAGGQRVQEAGAGGLQVEASGAGRAQLVGHQHRRGRQRIVRRAGPDDHQVDLRGVDAGHRQRVPGGVDGEGGGRLVIGGDATLADAGAGLDPFVRGVDHGRQLGVGHDAQRRIHPPAGDDRIRRHAFLLRNRFIRVDRLRSAAADASPGSRSRPGCASPCHPRPT